MLWTCRKNRYFYTLYIDSLCLFVMIKSCNRFFDHFNLSNRAEISHAHVFWMTIQYFSILESQKFQFEFKNR